MADNDSMSKGGLGSINLNPLGRFADRITPNYKAFGEAKRELELSNEDAERVQHSIDRLDEAALESGGLFDLLEDWQSRRTITAKRLYATSAVIIAAVIWVGADIAKFSFLGVSVGNGSQPKFLFFLSVFVMICGMLYEYSRRIDYKIYFARIAVRKQALSDLQEDVNVIDEVLVKHSISADELFDDFREGLGARGYDEVHAYEAVKFYLDRLSKPDKGLSLLENAEREVLHLIASYAVLGLYMTGIQYLVILVPLILLYIIVRLSIE